MKETVKSLSEKLKILEKKRGNFSVSQGVVWNYEQLIEVIDERNKHREIIKIEITNYDRKGFEYTIFYYNDYEGRE